MNDRLSSQLAYYDLAGDLTQLQRELRESLRGAWLRGAATATCAFAASGLAWYALARLA